MAGEVKKTRRKKGGHPPREEDVITIKARRVTTTVVVFLFLDEKCNTRAQVEGFPRGRDETQVVPPEDAYAFFFADRKHLHEIGDDGQTLGVYEGEEISNTGPTFYLSGCVFGSAAEFLRQHPQDLDLEELVRTKRGGRLVMVPSAYTPSGVVRHYRQRDVGDQILVDVPRGVGDMVVRRLGPDMSLVEGEGEGGMVN